MVVHEKIHHFCCQKQNFAFEMIASEFRWKHKLFFFSFLFKLRHFCPFLGVKTVVFGVVSELVWWWSDVWSWTKVNLSFFPSHPPPHVRLRACTFEHLLWGSVLFSKCNLSWLRLGGCFEAQAGYKSRALRFFIYFFIFYFFWSIGAAAGVHLSASSAGPAVAVETKHGVCFGVRQTFSLDPSHTQFCSLLFGGFCGVVAPVGQGGQIPPRSLSLEEIRPAVWHARHLMERNCTSSSKNNKTITMLVVSDASTKNTLLVKQQCLSFTEKSTKGASKVQRNPFGHQSSESVSVLLVSCCFRFLTFI